MAGPDGNVNVSINPQPRDTTAREHVLRTAEQLVMGDRNKDYSDPSDNFRQTADLWEAYLGTPIKAHDVAVLMILAKVARLSVSPDKADSWIDIAGYAACGAETRAATLKS
jgi:hypothetical protein